MARRGRGWPTLAALSNAQRDEARAQLGRTLDPVPSARRTKVAGRKTKGSSERSKPEADYEEWLAAQRNIRAVRFEPIRVVLPADRMTYAPDFLVSYVTLDGDRVDSTPFREVITPDGTYGYIDAIEVKPAKSDGSGDPFIRPSAWIKTKIAAEVLAPLGIRVLIAWHFGREWRHRVVRPK